MQIIWCHLRYPLRLCSHVDLCCLCLPLTGTALTIKQRSRIGSPSFQHHLMSLNSGLLCKTFGFIWRLCLLGVTSLKTCHRYSQCLYLYVLKITSSFLAKTKTLTFSQCRKQSDFKTSTSPGLLSCSTPKTFQMWQSAVWVIQFWDSFYQIFRNSWSSVKNLLQGKALSTHFGSYIHFV